MLKLQPSNPFPTNASVAANWHIMGGSHDPAVHTVHVFTSVAGLTGSRIDSGTETKGQNGCVFLRLNPNGHQSLNSKEKVKTLVAWIFKCFTLKLLSGFVVNLKTAGKEREGKKSWLTATAAEPMLPVPSSSCSDSDWKTKKKKKNRRLSDDQKEKKTQSRDTTWLRRIRRNSHTAWPTPSYAFSLVTLLWSFPADETWPKGVRQIEG